MLRWVLLVLLLIPSFASAELFCELCHVTEVSVNEKVIDVAKSYLYVREKTNNNDAPEITEWLKNVGLGSGYAYCQAFVYSDYKQVFNDIGVTSPLLKTAKVSDFAKYSINNPLTFKTISTKQINWGVDKPQIGDVASWKHGSSVFNGFNYFGHAGLVISTDKNLNIYTIEGNTKAGDGGDQSGTIKGDMTYGHEGVYERTRQISLKSNFPIMYFIRLNKRVYEIKIR